MPMKPENGSPLWGSTKPVGRPRRIGLVVGVSVVLWLAIAAGAYGLVRLLG